MNDLKDLLSKLTLEETDSDASICESCGCDMNMPPAPEPMIALSDILKLAGMAPDMSQMAQPMEADEVHPDGKCECPHCGNVHTPGATNEDEMEEGNEFSGALAKAKEEGEDEFEVDGKQYKVEEDTISKSFAEIYKALQSK